MFDLKFPVPIPPPRRADRTLLPAALTALLGLLLVVQLAVPSPVELADVGFARPLRLAPLVVPALAADPEIAARPLFSPRRRDSVEVGVADKAAPLEGARIVGIVTVRGRARLFVQALDGRVTPVALGGSYKGWQLVRIDAGQVLAVRGAERAVLAVSPSAAPVATAPAADGEEPEVTP